jgi:bacterioferritin (cytochrome b1)
VIRLLNEALATEIICVLRYRRHHFMAAGINAEAVAAEFLVHANGEQQHAGQIAARIGSLDSGFISPIGPKKLGPRLRGDDPWDDP